MARYDEFDGIPMHDYACYYCAGDSPVDGADHADTHPCDAIGHQYGTSSEDFVCYGCGAQACDPAMIDPLWHEHQERAYRAADYFGGARAARDDIAAGAYPSLSPTPIVLAPYYVNGTLVGRFAAQITGLISRGTRAYFVRFADSGMTRGAFGHELVTV